jgi:hypothetical protein
LRNPMMSKASNQQFNAIIGKPEIPLTPKNFRDSNGKKNKPKNVLPPMDDPDLTEADLEKLKFCGQSFINTIVTTNENIVKFKAKRGTRAFKLNECVSDIVNVEPSKDNKIKENILALHEKLKRRGGGGKAGKFKQRNNTQTNVNLRGESLELKENQIYTAPNSYRNNNREVTTMGHVGSLGRSDFGLEKTLLMEDSSLPVFEGQVAFDKRGEIVSGGRDPDKSYTERNHGDSNGSAGKFGGGILGEQPHKPRSSRARTVRAANCR